MHIIGGQFKGQALKAPSGTTTRPTGARARETIFNLLEHASWTPGLEGIRVLDGFAGSGSLGFEALSRGAGFCLFIDISAQARGAIRSTIEALGLHGVTRLHRRDFLSLSKKPAALGPPFDLVFLDPPYGLDLEKKALLRLVRGEWLSPEALVIVETKAHAGTTDADLKSLVPNIEEFNLLETRTHGMARHWFLKRREEP